MIISTTPTIEGKNIQVSQVLGIAEVIQFLDQEMLQDILQH